jgi:hypothetical protein
VRVGAHVGGLRVRARGGRATDAMGPAAAACLTGDRTRATRTRASPCGCTSSRARACGSLPREARARAPRTRRESSSCCCRAGSCACARGPAACATARSPSAAAAHCCRTPLHPTSFDDVTTPQVWPPRDGRVPPASLWPVEEPQFSAFLAFAAGSGARYLTWKLAGSGEVLRPPPQDAAASR